MSLADRFRRLLGTDTLTRLEKTMADDFLTLFRNIAENTKSLDATQQAVALNIKNGFSNLETKVADLTRQLAEKDQVDEEIRALAAGINEDLGTIGKNVEAMDNGYEPAPAEPETPAEPVPPVVPGDETPTQEVPADPPTPAPAEGETPADSTGRRGR